MTSEACVFVSNSTFAILDEAGLTIVLLETEEREEKIAVRTARGENAHMSKRSSCQTAQQKTKITLIG